MRAVYPPYLNARISMLADRLLPKSKLESWIDQPAEEGEGQADRAASVLEQLEPEVPDELEAGADLLEQARRPVFALGRGRDRMGELRSRAASLKAGETYQFEQRIITASGETRQSAWC